ncbi:hypothetical protein [Sulfitobacter dubius]|uniref:hypothetical protein n=1 Tax=Sulfitobacter dubius TaxID=218673 RepID=UPI0022AE8B13|nr:hypothetical protein [Sulfitobacter dubius]MCZ4366627.1 hypothetical protein [Sulfitobacter dubius]
MAEGLYSDFELDELKGLRRKILEQRAKGVSQFSYNGQSFTYSSPSQMLIVAEEIQREIGRKVAAANGWQPISTGGWSTFRPLSGGNQ